MPGSNPTAPNTARRGCTVGPDVEVTGVSDEHGRLNVGPHARRLLLGEKVWLIPGHCDPTVNLHDWYVGIRNGRVELLWPISARGASI